MAEIAKNSIKEKVVRIIVSTWKNMLATKTVENTSGFVGNKILGLVENLSSRKWSDNEISEDLALLKEILSNLVATLRYFVYC